jgi:hypothetical protein
LYPLRLLPHSQQVTKPQYYLNFLLGQLQPPQQALAILAAALVVVAVAVASCRGRLKFLQGPPLQGLLLLLAVGLGLRLSIRRGPSHPQGFESQVIQVR